MTAFVAVKKLSANQMQFIDLIVERLTENGSVKRESLYESPFTDVAPTGPDQLFSVVDLNALLSTLEAVRQTALVA